MTTLLPQWRKKLEDLESLPYESEFAQSCRKQASHWSTCAIGERLHIDHERARLEQKRLSLRVSQEAVLLGYAFSEALDEGDIAQAQLILKKIEKLATIHEEE